MALNRGKSVSLEGWSIGFAINGVILTLLGLNMTTTWPLSKVGFPFDDIIFGEPSLAFGILLLAAAVILWRKSNLLLKSEELAKMVKEDSRKLIPDLIEMTRPLSYFAAVIGLGLIAIAFAGVTFQLFAAPPEEPISGRFADYPMLEATFISGLYALTGIGAVLFPFGLAKKESKILTVTGVLWAVVGVALALFGAMNYFTHIGLIVNTMS